MRTDSELVFASSMYGFSSVILSRARKKAAVILDVLKGFLTQSSAKFAERTCIISCEDKFSKGGICIEKENTALYAFRKFGDTVLRTAYACCGSYSEAEDIAQDVFLLLHTKPVNFANDEHMKAWLLRVAINKSKNVKRSFRIRRTDPINEGNAGEYSMDVTDVEVRELIEKLPHRYSSVIYLHFYEGYTIKEIAEILGKNENTVSSLLQRGKAKLRSEFDGRV